MTSATITNTITLEIYCLMTPNCGFNPRIAAAIEANMTKREIASLGCKLLAIYALIQAAGMTQQPFTLAVMYLFGDSHNVGGLSDFSLVIIVLTALPCAATLGVAMGLWFCSEMLAHKIARGDTGMPQVVPVDAQEIRSVAFSVLGVFLVVQAVVQATHFVTLLMQENSLGNPFSFSRGPNIVGELSKCLVQLAAGLWLVFGARGLGRLPSALRNVGRDAEPADELQA